MDSKVDRRKDSGPVEFKLRGPLGVVEVPNRERFLKEDDQRRIQRLCVPKRDTVTTTTLATLVTTYQED